MVLLRGAQERLQEFSHHRSLSQGALRWSLRVLSVTAPECTQVSPSSCYQLRVWGDLNYSRLNLALFFQVFRKGNAAEVGKGIKYIKVTLALMLCCQRN